MRERLTEKQIELLDDAYRHFVGKAITGYLSDAHLFRGALVGLIYGHKRKTVDGMFLDGHMIHSSTALKAWQVDRFSLVQTRNSLYVVASWRIGTHADNLADNDLPALDGNAFPQLTIH